MAERQLIGVLRHLRRAVGPRAGVEERDGQLLGRFAEQRDEAAFEALLLRHGPMVLTVCRRILSDSHEAEDAFQATFLVLVRKAGSLRRQEFVGGWLHGVAYRTAVRARVNAAKRRLRQQQAALSPEQTPDCEVDRRELRQVLDEELHRLPEKYRTALVLCYLEGKTHEEAAEQIGCPKGTVETRLARARERLRRRLLRRGFGASAGTLVAVLTQQVASPAVPTVVAEATVQLALRFAAGGMISGQVGVLADAVLQGMFVTKLKTAALLLVALAVIGSGAGAAAYHATAAEPAEQKTDDQSNIGPDVLQLVARAGAVPNLVINEAPRAQTPDERNILDVKDKMTLQLAKFEGFDDPKTTLEEALFYLVKRCDVQFDIDQRAFEADGLVDVFKVAVVKDRWIPEMPRFTGAQLLRKVTERIPAKSGVTWMIRDGQVVLTTQAAARAELGVPDEQPLLPLVYTVLSKRPLEEALQELAASTGINVVFDPRAAEKARTGVTARLMNVPLDRAVRLLADMADLKAVVLGNVIYVTSKDNAPRWEKEAAKFKPAKIEVNRVERMPRAR